MSLKSLQDRLRTVLTDMQSYKSKESLSDDEATKYNRLLEEGHALKSQIETAVKAESLESWAGESAGFIPLAKPGAAVEDFKAAGAANLETKVVNGRKSVLVNDEGEMLIDEPTYKAISSPEYRQAFKAFLRRGDRGLKAAELKVLEEDIDTAGGYLAPEEILNRLIAREPAPQTIASRVTRMNTSRDALAIPRVVYTTDNLYTSGMRVTWTGEVPASATIHRVTEPSFGMVRIPIFTAMMSLPLTRDMIEDSSYPIVEWCTSKFQETIDLLYENMIINGAGATQPDGILINAQFIANDVHSGAAAALTWDGLVNLAYNLPEQYDRNAVMVMNKTNCARQIAQLQDGNGRPYWTEGAGDNGLAGQRINRPLLGYPVVFNAFMPNVGAGNYPIVFGDLTGYYLVNRIGFSIETLRELYAETNQVVMLGRIRFGGQLVEDFRVRGHVVAA